MIWNATSSFPEQVGTAAQGFDLSVTQVTFPVPDLPTGAYFIMRKYLQASLLYMIGY